MANPNIVELKAVTFRDASIEKLFQLASDWLKEHPMKYGIDNVSYSMSQDEEDDDIHYLTLYTG